MVLNQLLTVQQVAGIFHVSTRTVYRWESNGKIPSIRIGGVIRFTQESVDNLQNNRS